jgi:hypothetical protein
MTNLKEKFEAYFADLKADAKRAGYTVNKRAEWARWVEKSKED